jgi:hypothetical protein
MGKHTLHFVPRLLSAPQAAAYLSISESKLLTLDIPRKESGGRKLFDRIELDAWADSLPYEGGNNDGW